MGLVGLYACRVKRLRSEKRKRHYFCGLLRRYFCGLRSYVCGLLRSCSLLASLALFGLRWFVLVVLLLFLFSFGRYDKKKGQAVGACPLFVGCGLVKFLYSY